MCQRNAWPLHHQSGSVPATPTPNDQGRLRSPLEPIDQPYADWMRTIVFARWITSRGVPAPCIPTALQKVQKSRRTQSGQVEGLCDCWGLEGRRIGPSSRQSEKPLGAWCVLQFFASSFGRCRTAWETRQGVYATHQPNRQFRATVSKREAPQCGDQKRNARTETA